MGIRTRYWVTQTRSRGNEEYGNERCFPHGPCLEVIRKTTGATREIPYEGEVEYLHRSPASRRRRRKGKSRIWDNKIWSQVPRDSDPRMAALARVSSNFKRQTRHLIRESVSHQQIRNCLTVIQIWLYAPYGCFIPRQTGRLTVGRNIRLRPRLNRRSSGPPGLRILESERVKCGHESCGTRTWEWLRWRKPAPIVNDRPILSSERMLHNDYNRRCRLEK
jgi:hypothetical protein